MSGQLALDLRKTRGDGMLRQSWLASRLALCFVFGLVLASGFSVPLFAQSGQTTLLVSAASSLQDALKVIDPLFDKAQAPLQVRYNFAASGILQQQIEQGAPVDVFIAAAQKQMDALQAKNMLLPGTRQNLLANRLSLIVPSTSTLKLRSFLDLTNEKVQRISIGEPRSVPAGQYATEVFTQLNIANQIKSKLVYANSVQSVLAAVASGNVDAGIVYLTDAKREKQVKQVTLADENLHSPIVYPIAIIATSKNPKAARAYANFLRSRPAKAVFQQYGFGIS
jgi:molybdate transport system substrate-binding protein